MAGVRWQHPGAGDALGFSDGAAKRQADLARSPPLRLQSALSWPSSLLSKSIPEVVQEEPHAERSDSRTAPPRPTGRQHRGGSVDVGAMQDSARARTLQRRASTGADPSRVLTTSSSEKTLAQGRRGMPRQRSCTLEREGAANAASAHTGLALPEDGATRSPRGGGAPQGALRLDPLTIVAQPSSLHEPAPSYNPMEPAVRCGTAVPEASDGTASAFGRDSDHTTPTSAVSKSKVTLPQLSPGPVSIASGQAASGVHSRRRSDLRTGEGDTPPFLPLHSGAPSGGVTSSGFQSASSEHRMSRPIRLAD